MTGPFGRKSPSMANLLGPPIHGRSFVWAFATMLLTL
jgi:hypothetical protein